VDRFYFDNNASTPVSSEVLEALVPVLREVHGNASSIHYHGQMAKQRLEAARRQVAGLIHADPQEIVFLAAEPRPIIWPSSVRCAMPCANAST
jgi:cysteine desulfurase